ncbi:DUF397 domain-containing protein [Streptomyces kanasensis]|uniref:DUF397 domain-containing protein n=1 Tax=Streptomyces kanasensis TaxID=936756 RepID=UPI0039F72774
MSSPDQERDGRVRRPWTGETSTRRTGSRAATAETTAATASKSPPLFPGAVPVRDSKDPFGPVLAFDRAAWAAFVGAVRDGGLAE